MLTRPPGIVQDGRDEVPVTALRRTYNILHTVRGLRVDGVVMVVLRTVSHAGNAEFRHYVCSMLPEDDLANAYRERGIEPHHVNYRGILSAPLSVARLVALIRNLEIDLVHANRTMDLGIGGTAAKLCGVPVVSSLHWLGRAENLRGDAELGIWLRAKKTMTVFLNRIFAARVIAVSGAVRDSFTTFPGFPTTRTTVVYPGLDMAIPATSPEAGARLRSELGLTASNPILLNIGRLVPDKGQEYLIPMMQRVLDAWPDARLLIAGEGYLREALLNQIESSGLGDAVCLLGSRSDIDDLLAISDVLVLSSESEAAPLPPMEAMRARKPVVASCVGGIPEIVEDGLSGFVVPRAEPQALADAVLRLLKEPGRARRMGEAGRRIAVERFEIGQSVQALERIYRSLLEPDEITPKG
jgi:glycosyltransferase involved in cell wall biosynthesis